MIRVLVSLSLVLALFAGCEETPPFIDFSKPVKSSDTSYIATSVPAAQHKVVLIEDITGVRCVNCPAAAQKIRDIINAKTEDSVIAMALYPWPTNTNSLYNNTAPYPGFPQLANDISSQLVESLGIPQGLPNGYVDRKAFAPATTRPNAPSSWASLVNARLKLSTPVNITMTKSLNGKKLSLEVRLVYTEPVPGNHKFSLYLVEDKIISKQAFPTGTQDNYEHSHALRHTFDLAVGKPLNASLEPGRTFEKRFEYELPSEYNIDNCHVICVITDQSTEEVINARKIDLH